MAGFIRRFTAFPGLPTITEIESVDIIDTIPQGIFVGRATGTVGLVGEWADGPVNTPTIVEGDQTIRDFGGFNLSVVDPLSYTSPNYLDPYSNGNAFCWMKNKVFRRMVIVRVDMSLAEGVTIQLTGTPTPLPQDITIPAGTRVRDASAPDVEFALAAPVTFAEGTDLAVVAFTAFDDELENYATRTVSGIPVYSTKDTSEGAVADVDSVDIEDLFRAGIGAGTAFPTLALAASTGALDGSPANGAALTVLPSATIDARYTAAINTMAPGQFETDNVEIIASARTSDSIRADLLNSANDSASIGAGRVSLWRPPIGTLPATATGAAAPGVGAVRADRQIYCYPHFLQRIADIATLDPQAVISDPDVLIGADSAMASILSVLPPENNPGQSTQEFRSGGLLSFITDLERDLTGVDLPTKFTLQNYILFKAAGIAALRRDGRISEWVFQSGVTSVDPTAFPTLAPIKRRRMADFIQDSLAAIALFYDKKPNTVVRFNSLVGELTDFLDTLLSEQNPEQQRIADFQMDTRSGNSQALQGTGIRVLIIDVTLLDTMDHIVLQTQIGETITIEAIG